MRRVPTPDFGYPVIWLEVGELQVHLFDRKTEAPQYHHFALDVDDYTAAFNRSIEAAVRRAPEQWFWMHNRWKTRPRSEMA